MLGIRTPQQTTTHLGKVAEARTKTNLVDLTEEEVFISQLSSRIRKSWERAKTNKTKVEHNMLECLRERKGEYGPQELREIQAAGGSDIYIKLATSKIRAGIAHIKSILLPDGDRAYGIDPTKNPTLPEWINDAILERILQNPNMVDAQGQPIDPMDQIDLLQTLARREMNSIARTRARNMDRKIQDQLEEGQWTDAMSQFIDDFCTYPAAFMKGPFFAQEPRLKYENTQQGFKVKQTMEVVMKYRTINPFDAYPAAGVDSVHKGDFIERIRMQRNDLYSMLGQPGYNDQAIKDVLSDYRAQKLEHWLWTDVTRSHIADHVQHWHQSTTDLDGLHWYGKAQGIELIEWGMNPKLIDNPLMEYECDAILIGNHVVRAALNTDPLYRRPIHSSCYEKIPGSVFGNSPSMLMRSTSRMVNATGRALQNNLAHASGFQAEVDYTRVSGETDVFDLHPFKVWQTKESEYAGDRPAVRFFQPDSNAPELINVIDYFKVMADNDTGIPEFLHGGTGANTGADATAKGRAMLLDQSAKLLYSSIMNIDRDVCKPKIKMMYDYNMIHDPDEEIKGDCQVVPKGINARLQMDAARQSHMALLEVTGADPEDRQLIGLEGRAKLLKKMMSTFDDIDHDEIIPSDEELERRVQDIQNAPPPPDPAMLKIEAMQADSQARNQIEQQKIEQANTLARENRMGERMLKMMELRSKEQISKDELDKRVQEEIIKLRATRMSERERMQMDVLREKMKAEAASKMKVMELKANLQNPDNNIPKADQQVSKDDIRSIVESVVAPMISTFQNDTAKVMDQLTDSISKDVDASPSVINVNVDSSCTPQSKTITTSRDASGNLQATVTPTGANT